MNYGSFALLGDADPVPESLFVAYPEQAKTLALLNEVSRELASILDRQELLRRIAERVKKIVDYDTFSVMLWNESTQRLESAFGMRYEEAIPICRLFLSTPACPVLPPPTAGPFAWTMC